MTAAKALQFAAAGETGLIVCAREFMNSLDESSLAEVKAAIVSEPWLAAHFDIGEKYIRTKDGRIEYDFIGLARHLDSIKSKSRIRLLWVDEAEPVSEAAWSKAVNTVREEGAEIWVTWNPERKNSATHKRFRVDPPARSKIVELNWRDNPWFPDTLNRKRLEDMEKRPDSYQHVWEGGFVTALEGAYFASALNRARTEGRICQVDFDPLITVRLFCDIGGTGAKADAFAMWPAQFIGDEIRVRDYYEAVGQPLSAHIAWLSRMGYGPSRAQFWLPHDGASHDRVYAVSYESALRSAGYHVTVVPNQGRGAAGARVEEARRLFPQIRFDEATTEAGRDALGWYHEKRDEKRAIGLGPEHDWSSHAADAFGLMCVAHKAPQMQRVELGGI
jgi:phage terminase large subunit